MTKGKKASGLTRNDEVLLNTLSIDELKDLLESVDEEIEKRRAGIPNEQNNPKVVTFKKR